MITELLIVENSTPEALDLFKKVKANFMFEMKKREVRAIYECELINSLMINESLELEVNYEIVNAK